MLIGRSHSLYQIIFVEIGTLKRTKANEIQSTENFENVKKLWIPFWMGLKRARRKSLTGIVSNIIAWFKKRYIFLLFNIFLDFLFKFYLRCKQLEKEIEDLSSQMSGAIGSVDHIPSRSDYLNMKEDLSFREVSTACKIWSALLALCSDSNYTIRLR